MRLSKGNLETASSSSRVNKHENLLSPKVISKIVAQNISNTIHPPALCPEYQLAHKLTKKVLEKKPEFCSGFDLVEKWRERHDSFTPHPRSAGRGRL